MVWPFSRKKIVDLTESRFLPVKSRTANAGGYADLTSNEKTAQSSAVQKTAGSGSAFGNFFSAVSEASSSQSPVQNNLEAQGVKNKMEDFEYKLEVMRKKIDGLLDRLEVVERRAAFRPQNS